MQLSSCDIGGRLASTLERFPDFDFSKLISDPLVKEVLPSQFSNTFRILICGALNIITIIQKSNLPESILSKISNKTNHTVNKLKSHS